MPPDKCNSITAKAMGLIISLFDATLAQEVPFGIPQYVQCVLHGLTSVLLCVPYIITDRKSVDLAVACNGFPSVTEIIHIFHSDYFDCGGAFRTVLAYCCVTG